MNDVSSAKSYISEITKFLASFNHKDVESQTTALFNFVERMSRMLKLSYKDDSHLIVKGMHRYIDTLLLLTISYVFCALYK